MKQILLIRHAKSSWADSTHTDFERPLTPRGHEDAFMMGKILRERHLIPELLLMSSARRAQLTGQEILSLMTPEVQTEPKLYGISLGAFKELIQSQDDLYHFIGYIGHNPTLSYVLEEVDDLFGYLPTTGIAHLTFEVNHWKDVSLKDGRVTTVLTPKMFRHDETRYI